MISLTEWPTNVLSKSSETKRGLGEAKSGRELPFPGAVPYEIRELTRFLPATKEEISRVVEDVGGRLQLPEARVELIKSAVHRLVTTFGDRDQHQTLRVVTVVGALFSKNGRDMLPDADWPMLLKGSALKGISAAGLDWLVHQDVKCGDSEKPLQSNPWHALMDTLGPRLNDRLLELIGTERGSRLVATLDAYGNLARLLKGDLLANALFSVVDSRGSEAGPKAAAILLGMQIDPKSSIWKGRSDAACARLVRSAATTNLADLVALKRIGIEGQETTPAVLVASSGLQALVPHRELGTLARAILVDWERAALPPELKMTTDFKPVFKWIRICDTIFADQSFGNDGAQVLAALAGQLSGQSIVSPLSVSERALFKCTRGHLNEQMKRHYSWLPLHLYLGFEGTVPTFLFNESLLSPYSQYTDGGLYRLGLALKASPVMRVNVEVVRGHASEWVKEVADAGHTTVGLVLMAPDVNLTQLCEDMRSRSLGASSLVTEGMGTARAESLAKSGLLDATQSLCLMLNGNEGPTYTLCPILREVRARGVKLRSLELFSGDEFSRREILELTTLTTLQRFRLNGRPVQEPAVVRVLRNNPQLRELCLNRLTENIVDAIHRAPSLQALTLHRPLRREILSRLTSAPFGDLRALRVYAGHGGEASVRGGYEALAHIPDWAPKLESLTLHKAASFGILSRLCLGTVRHLAVNVEPEDSRELLKVLRSGRWSGITFLEIDGKINHGQVLDAISASGASDKMIVRINDHICLGGEEPRIFSGLGYSTEVETLATRDWILDVHD